MYAGQTKTAPVVLGYSPVRIMSGSMEASGFYKNDLALIREVNELSLERGDIIAYYSMGAGIPYEVNNALRKGLYDQYYAPEGIATYNPDWVDSLLGRKNELTLQAGKNGARIYFHEIVDIRQDENGYLYFQTKGTSNPKEDVVWTRQDLVIGKYIETAPFLTDLLTIFGSNLAIILLVLLPLAMVLFLLVIQLVDDIDSYGIEKRILKKGYRITHKDYRDKGVGYELSPKAKLQAIVNERTQMEKQEAFGLMYEKYNTPHWLLKHVKKQGWAERVEEKYEKEMEELLKKFKKTRDEKYITEYQNKKEELEKLSFRNLQKVKEELNPKKKNKKKVLSDFSLVKRKKVKEKNASKEAKSNKISSSTSTLKNTDEEIIVLDKKKKLDK